jgi:hypothetical protein
MRTLISTLIILALVVLFPVSASFAREGHAGHGPDGAGSDEITDPRGGDDRRGRGGEIVVYDDSDEDDGSDEDDDSDEDDLHDENDFDDRDNLNW